MDASDASDAKDGTRWAVRLRHRRTGEPRTVYVTAWDGEPEARMRAKHHLAAVGVQAAQWEAVEAHPASCEACEGPGLAGP